MRAIRFLSRTVCVLSLVFGLTSAVYALEIKLTEDLDAVEVMHNGELVRVQRIQDPEHELKGGFAKTSRKCPPFCIHAMEAAPGVTTVGEVEVFAFMQHQLKDGTGVMVDARLPAWHQKGTIPGSVNIPFTVFNQDPDDPELVQVLKRLGGVPRGEVGSFTRRLEELGLFEGDRKTSRWDFSHCKAVLLWCNGPWCDQSPRAIRGLVRLGYPADKLYYYRGGMQMWQILGLTTVAGDG